jgi:hypothetical protein
MLSKRLLASGAAIIFSTLFIVRFPNWIANAHYRC